MPEQTIKWYRTKLPKEKLMELTKRSDAKAFRQALLHIGFAAVLGVAAYFSWVYMPVWVTVIVFYLYATVFAFFMAATHELSHGTVFKTKFWNEFFLVIFSFLSFFDYVFFKTSHMKHHQYTVHHDLDLEIILPQKINAWAFISAGTFSTWKLRMYVLPIVRRSFGIITGEWEERIFPQEDKKLRRRLIWWSRIVLVGHIAMAVTFILTHQWFLLVMFSLAHYTGHLGNLITGFTQHAGLQPDIADFRYSCRTVRMGALLEFLYWQMNWHVEHHMYASVPLYNLKKLHEAIAHDTAKPKRLIPAWKEILYAIRTQKKDPDFFIRAEVPGAEAVA